jgi:hypothetical protein
MFRNRIALASGGLVAAFALATYVATQAADDKPAPDAAIDATTVEGKVLAIVPSRAMEQVTIAIHKVRLQTVGGKTFLVGQQYTIPEFKPIDGAVEWVSIEHIESMLVCDTLEQMEKVIEAEEEEK